MRSLRYYFFWPSNEYQDLMVAQCESAPREIPRPAGENAGLRDDAPVKGSESEALLETYIRPS